MHSVNDTPSVSIVKDTDRPSVWSDGPRNKYDPGYFHVYGTFNIKQHRCEV